MNTWIFIVAIVAIVMCADTVKKIAKARNSRNTTDKDVEQLSEKIATLEDRIRVLERIVTERNYDLRQKINSL